MYILSIFLYNRYLVGGFNPSEKYQSIGTIIPNIWKNKIHVPNHQPVYHGDMFWWYGIWLNDIIYIYVCVHVCCTVSIPTWFEYEKSTNMADLTGKSVINYWLEGPCFQTYPWCVRQPRSCKLNLVYNWFCDIRRGMASSTGIGMGSKNRSPAATPWLIKVPSSSYQ